jgi:hypothetical protein
VEWRVNEHLYFVEYENNQKKDSSLLWNTSK